MYAAARWLAAGLVASAMAGVGAAAFFVGGEQQDPGPKVTPAVDFFLAQHGTVTGDVPGPRPVPSRPAPSRPAPACPARSVQPGAVQPGALQAGRRGGRAAARRTAGAARESPGRRRGQARRAGRCQRDALVTHAPPAQRVTPRTALLSPARRGAAALVPATASPGP